MKFIVTVACLVMMSEIIIPHSFSAKILAAVPLPFLSHQTTFRPLWRELANRGHKVVLITTDAANNNITNLKEIEVRSAYDYLLQLDGLEEIVNLHNNFKIFEFMKFVYDSNFHLIDSELLHPEVQALIRNKSETFDLVITEYYYPFMAALAARFKCPIIGVVSMDAHNFAHSVVGNPIHPILYPSFNVIYSYVSSFKDRLFGVIYNVLLEYTLTDIYTKCNSRIIEYVNLNESFSLLETIQRVDMLLINANPVLYHSRPISAATINIGGGLHIRDAKPLTQVSCSE